MTSRIFFYVLSRTLDNNLMLTYSSLCSTEDSKAFDDRFVKRTKNMKNEAYAPGVYIADGAKVLGNVEIGENSSIWFNAVVRGDSDTITLGKNTNIQDNAVVHVDAGFPVHIGDYVTVGHGAIVHGATVGDNTLIGMGAIVMNGCRIGKNCIIGAGAVVTQGMNIPDHSLVLGCPASIKKTVSEEQAEQSKQNALHYVEEARAILPKTLV